MKPEQEPKPQAVVTEELINKLYGHAVAMHESIVDGRGAIGWKDQEVQDLIAAYRVEIEVQAKREGAR